LLIFASYVTQKARSSSSFSEKAAPGGYSLITNLKTCAAAASFQPQSPEGRLPAAPYWQAQAQPSE
jgi:hypothetical protein